MIQVGTKEKGVCMLKKKEVGMKFFLIGFLLFLMSCGSSYDKAEVSNCIGGYDLQTFAVADFDENDVEVENDYPDDEWFEERYDGGMVDPYGKIISLEDGKMTIDFVSNFNCADHIKYSVKYEIDGETLHLSVRSEDDGVSALCMCPKVLTFSVEGKNEDLENLNKITQSRSGSDVIWEYPLYKVTATL
jgi:hypothetical protein